MRYFKVTDPQMRSLFFSSYWGKGVQYKLNEFVYPQVGELFCYSDEMLTIDGFPEYDPFWLPESERRIFECECILARRMLVGLERPDFLSALEVGTYGTNGTYDLVRDTILTKGIKLIRELTVKDVAALVKEKFPL